MPLGTITFAANPEQYGTNGYWKVNLKKSTKEDGSPGPMKPDCDINGNCNFTMYTPPFAPASFFHASRCSQGLPRGRPSFFSNASFWGAQFFSRLLWPPPAQFFHASFPRPGGDGHPDQAQTTGPTPGIRKGSPRLSRHPGQKEAWEKTGPGAAKGGVEKNWAVSWACSDPASFFPNASPVFIHASFGGGSRRAQTPPFFHDSLLYPQGPAANPVTKTGTEANAPLPDYTGFVRIGAQDQVFSKCLTVLGVQEQRREEGGAVRGGGDGVLSARSPPRAAARTRMAAARLPRRRRAGAAAEGRLGACAGGAGGPPARCRGAIRGGRIESKGALRQRRGRGDERGALRQRRGRGDERERVADSRAPPRHCSTAKSGAVRRLRAGAAAAVG
eukprot:gene15081-biopygen13068